MHLAHGPGCVTVLAKNGHKGGGAWWQGATVIPALVFMNRQTAEERVARGCANREGTKAVVEAQALCSQGIEVWRLDLLVAIGPQGIDAGLVSVDDQDMRALRSGASGQNDGHGCGRDQIQPHGGLVWWEMPGLASTR